MNAVRVMIPVYLAWTRPTVTVGIIATMLSACGGSAGSANPVSPDLRGSVTVRTPTIGADVPPMALQVTLGAATRSSEPNRTVVFDGVVPGTHQVQLAGLSDFCALSGGSSRTVQVLAGQSTSVEFELQCPTVTGTQRMLAFINGNLFSMTEYGTRLQGLTSQPQSYFGAISPDGRRIAFTSNRDGNEEVYVANSDGSQPVNLTNSPTTRDSWPRWSPDGTRLVFYSWFTAAGPTTGEIYVINANGSGTWQRLTDNTQLDADPEWSPDGSKIVFMTERDGNQEIYVMASDGSQAMRLTNDLGLDGTPSWSPDGTRIAFATTRHFAANESYDIMFMNADGSNVVRLTTDPEIDVRPIWSPDGSRIIYSHRVTVGDYDVWIMNADGSGKKALLFGAGNHQAEDWGDIR